MTVYRAEFNDVPEAARLSVLLWPENDPAEVERAFEELIQHEDAVLFLADDGKPVGFAQCQLRHDYVEGTDSSPVGYLEGIYVAEGYRNKGCARALLEAREEWAKAKGCTEFASDCELTNDRSLAFHLSVGFEEANRIICFTKQL